MLTYWAQSRLPARPRAWSGRSASALRGPGEGNGAQHEANAGDKKTTLVCEQGWRNQETVGTSLSRAPDISSPGRTLGTRYVEKWFILTDFVPF